MDEFFAGVVFAHFLQQVDDLARGGAVGAGQAGAVDRVDAGSCPRGELLDHRGPGGRGAGAAEPRAEQLDQGLREEVVE